MVVVGAPRGVPRPNTQGLQAPRVFGRGTLREAPSTTEHQGQIWYRTPCVRARLHPVFLPGLGPPSLRARLPPAARRGQDPPFQVQRLIPPLTGGGSTSLHRPTKPLALVVSETNLRKFILQSTVQTVQHKLTTVAGISS